MSLRPGRGGQPAEPLLAPAAVSTAPTAAVVAAWFLWVLATIFALVAMILAAVILSRANSIQDGVDALRTCCAEVYSTFFSILAIVSSNDICTPIFSIPVGGLVIPTPGCWMVQHDLPCSLTGGVWCITVTSNDVTIKGGGFRFAIGPQTRGILVNNVTGCSISDLDIAATSQPDNSGSRGIRAILSTGVTIERVTFNGTLRGLQFLDVDQVFVDHCRFTEQAPSVFGTWTGIDSRGGFGQVYTNLVFTHMQACKNGSSGFAGRDMQVLASQTTLEPIRNVRISHCQFSDAAFVLFIGVEGLTVEDIDVTVLNPLSGGNMLQLQDVNSATIKDSKFWYPNTTGAAGSDGLLLFGVRDITLDNLDITVNSPAGTIFVEPVLPTLIGVLATNALIHIGQQYENALVGVAPDHTGLTDAAFGVTIRNCRLNGGLFSDPINRETNGVVVEPGCRGIDIEDTTIRNTGGGLPANEDTGFPVVAAAAVLVLGSSSVNVKRCEIYDAANGSPFGGDAVAFQGALSGNSLPIAGAACTDDDDCTSPQTCVDGFCTFAYSFPAAFNCSAVDNLMIGNAGCAVRNDGLASFIVGNRQHNNWRGSYCGASPPLIQAIGDAVKVGSNF